MGEHKHKTNGVIVDPAGRPTSGDPSAIRVVQNLRLQNDSEDGVTYLMFGDDRPELAVALTPDQTRRLILALEEHVQKLENPEILPGETGAPHDG